MVTHHAAQNPKIVTIHVAIGAPNNNDSGAAMIRGTQAINLKSAPSGAPIFMVTVYGSFIIGVHQAGDRKTGNNWGIVFWDDKGLADIFGHEKLAAFMAKIKPYQPTNEYCYGWWY